MRKSLYEISTGLVFNVLLLDDNSEYTPPEGFAVGPEAEIGDTIVDGVTVPQALPEVPPVAPDPQTIIRNAYIQLSATLQDKYESLLIAGAFHLERGNLSAVARKFAQAQAEMDANDPEEVAFFQVVQQALNLGA